MADRQTNLNTKVGIQLHVFDWVQRSDVTHQGSFKAKMVKIDI